MERWGHAISLNYTPPFPSAFAVLEICLALKMAALQNPSRCNRLDRMICRTEQDERKTDTWQTHFHLNLLAARYSCLALAFTKSMRVYDDPFRLLF